MTVSLHTIFGCCLGFEFVSADVLELLGRSWGVAFDLAILRIVIIG